MPHLAILLEDGSVYDFSLEEKVSLSKEWILKLPKKYQYHGYSDQKGILYFVDGELKSPVIKYHKSLNQQGHDIIPINNFQQQFTSIDQEYSEPKKVVFRCSISIGPIFWLLGSTEFGHPKFLVINDFLTNVETTVWYKKKEKLGHGPDLPSFMMNNVVDDYQKFCTASLNSTHLMIFGFLKQNDLNLGFARAAIVDFYNQLWIDWMSLNFKTDEVFHNCYASIVFEKTGKAYIWLLIQKLVIGIGENQLQLMSHELFQGDDWETQTSYTIGERILSSLFFVQYQIE